MIELQIVTLFGLLPLAFGLLQVALLFTGAAQLDYVAFEAARSGAMADGEPDAMRRAATRAMVPQSARHDPAVAAGNLAEVAALAFTVAAAEVTAFMTIDPDRPRRDLLSVRVTYCHPLRVPLVPALLVPLLRRLDPQLPHQRCYAASRVPLIARAVVPLPRLAGPAGPDGSAGP